MAKVLLIYANSFMDNLIPTGVSLLSACLKKAGHETKLFDTTFYRTVEKTGDDARVETLQVKSTNLGQYGLYEKKTDMVQDLREMIAEYKPALIGLSVVETTYLIGMQLLNGIQDIKIPKIVGGVQVTMAQDEVIREPAVDMICVGEGEEAIVELAGRIAKKQDYSDIKNLWVKKQDGTIVKNPLRPLIDINTLPMQDWDIYPKERFYKAFGGKHWISGPIEFNRGCVHRCAYCCNARLQDLYKGQMYPRCRDLDKFFEELQFRIDKYGLQYPYFIAENFLQGGMDRFREFTRRYKKIRLPFWAQTRPETMNEEVARELKEMNCERLSMGVEHGNDEFRRKVLNRFVSNDTIINAFKMAKKVGLLTFSNNIVGFPTETRELYFDTVELNRKLGTKSIINVFCAYRGTKLRDLAIEKNYMEKDAMAGDYRRDVKLNMPHLTARQVEGLQRTFLLYVNLPKDMWPEIEKAEKFDDDGNAAFARLAKLYREKYEPMAGMENYEDE